MICGRGFLQSPRRDRRIVVKQRDTHECLACIFESTPFKLHVTREQPRFRVDPPFWLKGNDLLGNLLRIVRFVGRDFDRAECEQRLRFARGIRRSLQILAKRVLRFVKFLQLGRSISQIEPEVGFYVCRIVGLAQSAQVFLGADKIFLVVTFHPEPL